MPLSLAVALALGSGGLPAATFNVTTNADSGAGSLRQAVLDANAAPGDDTITFADNLGTITLTGGQLDITETLTITGPAAGQTIDGDKDGGRIGRIFGVTSTTANLTLEKLTLTNAKTTAAKVSNNCSSSSGQGGAICTLGGQLTLTNSTVSGNTTTGGRASGGGVYSESASRTSTVTLTNSTVSGNTASGNGGGVASYSYYETSTVTLTNSTVSGNTASGNGGGVYSYSGSEDSTVTLTNSTVSGNTASGDGGGVASTSEDGTSTVTLTNSTVSGNTTTGSNAEGGGVYSFGGGSSTATLTNSTVSGNTASGNGGGVFSYGYSYNNSGTSTVTLTNSTVSGNTASGNGGGVYSESSSGNTVTLTSSILAGNVVGGTAGTSGTATGGTANDCGMGSGTATGSHNLIQATAKACGLTDGADNNLVGQDPLLAALADNGCATQAGVPSSAACVQTHALQAGSPAIDAGTADASLTTDQRGYGSRAHNGTADIGAFEFGASAPPTAGAGSIADQTATLNQAFSYTTPADLFADDGGVAALTLTATGLPPGLSATDKGDGTLTISGTPTQSGTSTVTITATDTHGQTTTRTFTLTVPVQYALTVTGSGSGDGTVTGNGLSCTLTAGVASGTCTATLNEGSAVTATTAAATGSTFSGWTDATCNGMTNPCSFNLTAAKTITAAFGKSQYGLTVTGGGTGSGTVTGNGLDCTLTAGTPSGTCTTTLDHGTAVAATAATTTGSTFSGWTDATCNGTTNPCAFNLTAAKTITAAFGKSQYGLTVTGGGNGSGTVTGNGLNCTLTAGTPSGTCTAMFDHGTNVSLTVAATAGTFGGWSDAGCGTASSCTFEMTAAKDLTATFQQATTTGGTTTGTTTTGTTTTGTTTGSTTTSGTDTETTAGNCRADIQCSDTAKLWIHRAYRGYYGRCAECGGFHYWCERLDAEGGGADLSPIIAAFGTSQEYSNRFSGLSDVELIHNLYRNMFNREAEPGGLEFYLDLLETYRLEWRDAHDGDDQGATEFGLSHIALDILLGAQGDDVGTLDAKLRTCEQF